MADVNEILEIVRGNVQSLLNDIDNIDRDRESLDVDHIQRKADSLLRFLAQLNAIGIFSDEVVQVVDGACFELQRIHCIDEGYAPPLVTQNCRGRLLYYISEEQLRFLVDMGFTAVQIGKMLHVSIRTVTRRSRNARNRDHKQTKSITIGPRVSRHSQFPS